MSANKLQALGTRGLGLTGWTVAEDGTITQDSATEAGVALLPLHVEEKRALRSLVAKLRRPIVGPLPETAPSLQLQRRLDGALETDWQTVTGVALTYSASATNTLSALRLDFGTGRGFISVPGNSYRLRLTGEDGANAQALELIDVEAR